jgi:glutaredoxin 3
MTAQAAAAASLEEAEEGGVRVDGVAVRVDGVAVRVAGGAAAAAAAAACMETILRLAGESAVVVFSVSTCCMCHVAKQLLGGLGVNLTVYEVDELAGGDGAPQILAALAFLLGGPAADPVPAIFVGGKLVGGLDHVMAAHISGALVPLLKQAGALWL